MFYHLVREWSDSAELEYCKKILNYLDRHLEIKSNDRKKRILVVGFGMGRILH
jgi:hypothetical protein